MKHIRINQNDCYYPDELQDLNIGDGNYSILYEIFQDYTKVYYRNNDMYLKRRDFIEKGPLFVTDTKKHPGNL